MNRLCVFMLFVLCATLAMVFCGLAGEAALLQLFGGGFALFVHYVVEPVKAMGGDEAQLLEIAKLRAEIERKDEEFDKAWRHDLNDKNNVQALTDEVLRLNAEVERVKALNHSQFGVAIRRNAEIERLTAELAALKPDAERYQWLCDGNGYFLEERGLCGHSNEKAHADAAIDEKRKELQP